MQREACGGWLLGSLQIQVDITGLADLNRQAGAAESGLGGALGDFAAQPATMRTRCRRQSQT